MRDLFDGVAAVVEAQRPIEAAVEEGRGVWDNLVKFIAWTLPTNGGEALAVGFAAMLIAVLVGEGLTRVVCGPGLDEEQGKLLAEALHPHLHSAGKGSLLEASRLTAPQPAADLRALWLSPLHADNGIQGGLVLINPVLSWASEEMAVAEEGCLSVPTIYDKVERHARVTVEALDRDGKTYRFEAEDLLAVCVQHEMDHLLGKVFVEYLSPLKRNRIRSKMLKRSRDDESVA